MGANDTPIVSVAMGVLYKQESLSRLQRSVKSVLDQTFRDFEFLICDDGSSAAANHFLDECCQQDSRIRLLRPGDKFDLASKLNVCLWEARGTYIARMDDDDYSIPERFQRQVELLNKRKNISFVGSNVSLMRNGELCGERLLPEHPHIKDFYMTQPYIHPTLMFRKEALDAVGGYSEDKRQVLCEDYDLLLRLYAAGYQGMNLQDKLLEYTLPDDAKGNRKMRHRWNEAVTRWERFQELGKIPRALPYVVKPLVVGLLPERVLMYLKMKA